MDFLDFEPLAINEYHGLPDFEVDAEDGQDLVSDNDISTNSESDSELKSRKPRARKKQETSSLLLKSKKSKKRAALKVENFPVLPSKAESFDFLQVTALIEVDENGWRNLRLNPLTGKFYTAEDLHDDCDLLYPLPSIGNSDKKDHTVPREKTNCTLADEGEHSPSDSEDSLLIQKQVSESKVNNSHLQAPLDPVIMEFLVSGVLSLDLMQERAFQELLPTPFDLKTFQVNFESYFDQMEHIIKMKLSSQATFFSLGLTQISKDRILVSTSFLDAAFVNHTIHF